MNPSFRFFLLLSTLSLQCSEISCFGQWLMVQPFYWRQRGWLPHGATLGMPPKPLTLSRDVDSRHRLDQTAEADDVKAIIKAFDKIRKPRFG